MIFMDPTRQPTYDPESGEIEHYQYEINIRNLFDINLIGIINHNESIQNRFCNHIFNYLTTHKLSYISVKYHDDDQHEGFHIDCENNNKKKEA